MTLSFSEKLDGKPTHFVHKIWIGLDRNKSILGDREALRSAHFFYFMPCVERQMCYPDWSADAPKIHTIRADGKSRWRVGMPIHFVVKNRTPQRFQFAPILPCKNTQSFEVEWVGNDPIILIDGRHFYEPVHGIDNGMAQLAKNDGFDSVQEFLNYFNHDFKGKIIHWTDFIYSF